jgi:hypothetical protein
MGSRQHGDGAFDPHPASAAEDISSSRAIGKATGILENRPNTAYRPAERSGMAREAL